MSQSAPISTPAQPPTRLQPGPFRERLIVYLLPYFMPLTDDFELARAEVLETLASYGARTRSEMINAARIIAFSFSALEVLAEAESEDLPPGLRLRYCTSANALNRSCQHTEKTLARALACDVPVTIEPTADPIDDMPPAQIDAALAQAKARIDTYRNRLSGARPATSPQAISASQHAPGMRASGIAMLNALAQNWNPAESPSPS
ncbi:MAG: hypothetical protein ABSC06_10070 [Rhodopila sp.]|jgi:hypothetical protein